MTIEKYMDRQKWRFNYVALLRFLKQHQWKVQISNHEHTPKGRGKTLKC